MNFADPPISATPDSQASHGSDEPSRTLDQLEDKYRRLLAANPTSATTWALYGLSCMRNRDFGGAVDKLERAVALHPCEASFHVILARALVETGGWQDASIHYTTAMALDPDNRAIRDEWEDYQARREIFGRVVSLLDDKAVGPGLLKILTQEYLIDMKNQCDGENLFRRERASRLAAVQDAITSASAAMRTGAYRSSMKERLAALKAREAELIRGLAPAEPSATAPLDRYRSKMERFLASLGDHGVKDDSIDVVHDLVNHLVSSSGRGAPAAIAAA